MELCLVNGYIAEWLGILMAAMGLVFGYFVCYLRHAEQIEAVDDDVYY